MTTVDPKEALYEDLVKDWQDQKTLIKEQIALIDPMATSLRKSTAQRFLNATLNIVMELLMYILAIASIAYVFFLNNLGPFYLVEKIITTPEVKTLFSEKDLNNFDNAIKVIFVILAILFIIIGRMLANIRHKNTTLSLAGKNMKTISGQHLGRKTAIEMLEQRHVMTLPKTDIKVDSVQMIDKTQDSHNDTLL